MKATADKLALSRRKAAPIRVDLTGCSANSAAMVSRCLAAGEAAGMSKRDADLFLAEAISGDREHLIATILAWFEFSDGDHSFLTSGGTLSASDGWRSSRVPQPDTPRLKSPRD